ncbi:K+-transporting ATPase ATPase C chain [Rosenbergiella nectarea]|uniref:Potassium-transporting ATPase KdpC subunit n=2 Tax=Rosenbergiella nectarea TaxID=988801 RepID=A0A1H9JT04_9GAMM|nr:K+-transporting ATPase ATPase C chain [Rosenbergiella nectarea]
MMNLLRPALLLLVLLTVITGGVYPLLTTVIGDELFPQKVQGSLIVQQGNVRGSQLIGQDFSHPGYFQGRPSATADHANNPMASGGSNLSVTNPQLIQRVDQQITLLRSQNPEANTQVPTELITTSASGLEPMLSVAAVQWQIPRVARARQLSVSEVEQLVQQFTTKPLLSFMGPAVVNVVSLNLALDQYSQGK